MAFLAAAVANLAIASLPAEPLPATSPRPVSAACCRAFVRRAIWAAIVFRWARSAWPASRLAVVSLSEQVSLSRSASTLPPEPAVSAAPVWAVRPAAEPAPRQRAWSAERPAVAAAAQLAALAELLAHRAAALDIDSGRSADRMDWPAGIALADIAREEELAPADHTVLVGTGRADVAPVAGTVQAANKQAGIAPADRIVPAAENNWEPIPAARVQTKSALSYRRRS